MIIPYRTDAPVYHFPWATIGIIACNVAIQIWATATDYASALPLLLHFGHVAPHQWLTHVFLHAGWVHLIGNMVFLWVFGLVVEGKIGWWRFLVVYGAIALAAGLIEQVAMLGGHGYALGASGVITGLIAIAMVWAPENRIDCVLLFLGFHSVEWPIKGFAALFLVLQVFYAATSGFGMSSEMLHLTGAVCGLPLGILLLRKGWVDCEGWDWFSRSEARRKPDPLLTPPDAASARTAVPAATLSSGPALPAQEPAQAAVEAEYLASFCQLIDLGQLDPALALWRAHAGERWQTPASTLERCVGLLVKAQRVGDATPFLDRILAEDPSHPAMGLVRAQLLIRERRPASALELLEAIRPRLNPGRQRELSDRLRAQCAALQAEGVVELG